MSFIFLATFRIMASYVLAQRLVLSSAIISGTLLLLKRIVDEQPSLQRFKCPETENSLWCKFFVLQLGSAIAVLAVRFVFAEIWEA